MAFGVVLFEMLSGTKPFAGDDVADTLAAVLRAETNWTLVLDCPVAVQQFLRRCLQKDPRERLAHIGEARYQIKQALSAPDGDTGTDVTRRNTLRPPRRSTLIAAAVVYAAIGGLHAVPFDLGQLRIVGEPALVVDQVVANSAGAAEFSFSPDGMLAYITGVASNTYLPRTLVWVDRDGREDPIYMPARSYTAPDISPDGTHVAVTIRDVANDDLWVVDLTRETERRLTRDPAVDEAALWTPDGAGIVFQSGRERDGIFYMRADGTSNGWWTARIC